MPMLIRVDLPVPYRSLLPWRGGKSMFRLECEAVLGTIYEKFSKWYFSSAKIFIVAKRMFPLSVVNTIFSVSADRMKCRT